MAESCVVVGAGGISRAWFGPLVKEGVDVKAVVDLRHEAAEGRIKEYELSAEPMTDVASALDKHRPDFVVDLTIPEAHCDVTCTALGAGCHVIGEKPMASSLDEARKMVVASEAAGKLYMVSQSRRYSERHDQVRRTLGSGAVGPLTTIACDFYMGCHFGGFRDQMPSPLILDMAIHHFDLVRFMTGLDPVSVYAQEFNPAGSWYAGDVSANCIFEMTDGTWFCYRGSWCAEGCHTSWNGDWRFIGQQGTLLYEHDKEPYGQIVAGDEGFNRPLADAPIVAGQVPAGGQHGALKELLAFLRDGTMPQGECHDNFRSLAMVFGVIESSREGRKVAIETI